MRKAIDISGQKYGKLFVVSRADNSSTGRVKWNCRCDCGVKKVVAGNHLKSGAIISCGCLAIERGKQSATHKMSKTRTYGIWNGMWQRCTNPNSSGFYLYGGRGIKVCGKWESFENFFADMGEAPTGKSLDRINSDLDYSPENCRWADDFVQANNTRRNRYITINGETLSHTQWSKRLGGNPNLVYLRIRAGWSAEDAVTVPVFHR